MQLKIKNKLIYQYSAKRLLYTLCFFLFCVIDQRIKTCTGLDGWLETFRDLTGVGMAVIIMSHYKWEEFRKWKLPYIIWSVLSVVGGVAAFWWGMDNRPFLNDWLVVIIDIILFGYILIHTFISVVLEKQYPKLNKKFGVVWLLMMAWMILSRSDAVWPFCYLVMFGCFYLTDFTREEQEELFQGMLDGIILGFFIMQGLCFVFRPYDVLRYQGIYHNPNLNVLFYLEVLTAVFAKLIGVTKNAGSKWIKMYYWVGTGVVLSFILLTIGRAGWLAAMFLMGMFLWAMNKIQVPKRFFKNLMTFVLCVALTFPLCFSAVRYLPPVFHHPIWFWGEWNEERVHSWDEWDSEKYIEIDEYFEAAVGRIFESFANLLEHSPLALTVHAEADMSSDTAEEAMVSNVVAVLTDEEGMDSFLVRSTIYKHYFKNLNMWGYPYEEQGFQLTAHYRIGHAHNIFLQFGTDFGIPMMITFGVLIIWCSVILRRKFYGEKADKCIGNWMFLLVPILFGMFEYSWGAGSLSLMMLFVAWRQGICDEL